MGNLANFEAFKLNKVQMNAIAGGAVTYNCTTGYADGDRVERTVTVSDEYTQRDVERELTYQSLGGITLCNPV